MKTLKFRPRLIKLILSGEKNVTWRLFDDKDITAGDEVALLNWETKEEAARAVVEEVKLQKLGNLSPKDWEGHEKFRDQEEMYETYRTYYPGREVGPETELKIIKFRLN